MIDFRSASALLRACGLAAMWMAAQPAMARWSFVTELGMNYDDNLGNARSGDSLGDRSLTAALGATQASYFDDGGSFAWGGRITGERYGRYAGLSNMALGINLSYRKKLDLGPFAPWWLASWSSSALNYRDRARDGWLHQADIGTGKRFGERIKLDVNFRVEQRTASSQTEEVPGVSGDAFSLLSKSVAINAEYALRSDTVLSLGGQVRSGDVVSSSHRYRQVFLYSKAIAEDQALGADVYAYRLAGNTLILNLGMAQFLSPDAQMNAVLRRMITHGEGGNNYAKTGIALSWTGSF